MQRRGIFHSVAKGFSQDFQMDGVGYYYICHIILMREFALKIKIYRMNGSYLEDFTISAFLKKVLIVEKMEFPRYNLRIQIFLVPKKLILVRLINENHQIILLIRCLQYFSKKVLIK